MKMILREIHDENWSGLHQWFAVLSWGCAGLASAALLSLLPDNPSIGTGVRDKNAH